MKQHLDHIHADDTLVIGDESGQTPSVSRYESAPVSSDQRQSYRYPAQPGRDIATVRTGQSTWQARLCEESAGGMAIVVSGEQRLNVGDEVEIGIYTGWYRVCVVHSEPVEGGQRVGLRRISTISTEEDKPRRKDQSKAPGQARSLAAVACAAMIVGIGATHFLDGFFTTPQPAVQRGLPAHLLNSSSHQAQGVLIGVNVLLEPEVAEGLELTKSQQDSIEGYLVGVSNSLAKAHEDSQDLPPEVWYEQSQAIVNRALENILCSLTDEQILKWRALMLHRQNLD